MSATVTVTSAASLRASDALTLTRDDGSTIQVTLDVLRAWFLTPTSAAPVAPVITPAAPPAPTVKASADGTVVTTVGPMLTDSLGNTYAINAAGQVVTNRVAETGQNGTAFSSQVVAIAMHAGYFWQKNKPGSWYYRKNPQSPYVQMKVAG